MITRRRLLAATVLAPCAAAGYGRYVEAFMIEPVRKSVNLGARSQGFKLLQLSDFHASDVVPLNYIERVAAQALAMQPDLICLTGDFITGRFNALKKYSVILKTLAAKTPCYAVFGNHDGGAWSRKVQSGYTSTAEVGKMLTDSGIEILHNRSIELKINGVALSLTGVGDLWAGECVPAEAFAAIGTHQSLYKILLCHNPDAKNLLLPYPWDLMLCGHTHGGQLVIPVIGGTPFAPVRDRRFIAGLYLWEGRQFYISRGVGNLHGVRINCRPELTLLEIA